MRTKVEFPTSQKAEWVCTEMGDDAVSVRDNVLLESCHHTG